MTSRVVTITVNETPIGLYQARVTGGGGLPSEPPMATATRADPHSAVMSVVHLAANGIARDLTAASGADASLR